MEGINPTTHSCVAPSQIASESTTIIPSFRSDTLSKMKEFDAEEKPSLISRMYQDMKDFLCSIWNFIFCVKAKHDFVEAVNKTNAMIEGLGDHDFYNVLIQCGDAELKTLKLSGGMSEACAFQNGAKAWFESLEDKDCKGELSITVCPMDIERGLLQAWDVTKPGDTVKVYSSTSGERTYKRDNPEDAQTYLDLVGSF